MVSNDNVSLQRISEFGNDIHFNLKVSPSSQFLTKSTDVRKISENFQIELFTAELHLHHYSVVVALAISIYNY